MAKTVFGIATKKLPPAPALSPKTRFNNPVGPHRVFEACLFKLEDFKFISKTTETTINDVAITMVAGAIRNYLKHHEELPKESLSCMIPVDVSGRGESVENNKIGATICNIHTDIENSLNRLYAVSASTKESKQFVDTPLAEMARIPGILNPWISKIATRLYAEKKLTQRMPMGSCGAITNVVGPRIVLYSAGAKLVNYYCTGLLTPGVGMFQAIFSMNENISFSVLADRDIMPDPEFYKQCLQDELQELKSSADALKKTPLVSIKKLPATAITSAATASQKTNRAAAVARKKSPRKSAAVKKSSVTSAPKPTVAVATPAAEKTDPAPVSARKKSTGKKSTH